VLRVDLPTPPFGLASTITGMLRFLSSDASDVL